MKNKNKKSMKKLYLLKFNIVRSELNNLDPLGVLDDHNLVDEYDLENEMLLSKLSEVADHVELAVALNDIFKYTLAEDYGYQYFLECTKNIIDKISALEQSGVEQDVENLYSATCPICGKHTFEDEFDICPECGWEHDIMQYQNSDYVGGANGLSQNQYKQMYTELVSTHPDYKWNKLKYRRLSKKTYKIYENKYLNKE